MLLHTLASLHAARSGVSQMQHLGGLALSSLRLPAPAGLLDLRRGDSMCGVWVALASFHGVHCLHWEVR